MLERIKERAEKLKVETAAVYLAYRRKETPWYAKVFALAAVCYALSPIDLIPDFIPVLGYLDDLIILPLLIFLAVKWIPAEVMSECRDEARGLWQEGKPKNWKYAIPVFVIWLLIILAIVRAIWF